MKKIALIMAVLLSILSFASCASDSNDKSGANGTQGTTGGTVAPGEQTSGTAEDNKQDPAASDTAYVKDKGTLIVGITEFAPMDYKENDSDEWIGFDADMAKAFAKDLGVKAQFIVLSNWDTKSMELESKSIDVVWNGMTLTDDVKELMEVSEPYCMNAQVVVMKADKAENIKTVDDIRNLSFAVENGSAGANALDSENIPYTSVQNQAMALMEVASGTSDASVIDLLMAKAMVGEGTDYSDLVITEVELTSEEYGVGFRKGSDLAATFNDFWKKAYDAGTVMEKAETYGIAQNIIEK